MGEKFAEFWCKQNGKTFIKSTVKTDKEKGIDYWIDGIATDVKNTDALYLLGYNKSRKQWMVRHPFNNQSQATHYFFVHVQGNADMCLFKGHIPMLQFYNDVFKEGTFPMLKRFINQYHFVYNDNVNEVRENVEKNVNPLLKDDWELFWEDKDDGGEPNFKIRLKNEEVWTINWKNRWSTRTQKEKFSTLSNLRDKLNKSNPNNDKKKDDDNDFNEIEITI